MTSSIRRIIHFWRGVFRRPQRQQDEDEARAAAGGDSNYCQGTHSNAGELLPFDMNSLRKSNVNWQNRYKAESYGFPLNYDSTIAVKNQEFLTDRIYVYVGGSLRWNQSEKKYESGIGLFYGYEHPLTCYIDITKPVRTLTSRPDSTLIETMAAIVALKRLANWNEFKTNHKKVAIRSDSLTMIQQLSKVKNRYDSNGNYKGKGKHSLWKKLYANLHKIADSFPDEVEFQHVEAHCGDPGNSIADYLSRRALETWHGQAVWTNRADFTAKFHTGKWTSVTKYKSPTVFLQDVENMLAALP